MNFENIYKEIKWKIRHRNPDSIEVAISRVIEIENFRLIYLISFNHLYMSNDPNGFKIETYQFFYWHRLK